MTLAEDLELLRNFIEREQIRLMMIPPELLNELRAFPSRTQVEIKERIFYQHLTNCFLVWFSSILNKEAEHERE